jgi:hypothetical protein
MRQPNAIARERQRFEEILVQLSDPSITPVPQDVRRQRFDEGLDFIAQKSRPQNDVWIEWIYEIDLDHEIFHIDGTPFFSLECLPNDEDFLDYISSVDHYGHSACSRRCPPEHKYKKPAPPVVDDSDLATYRSLDCLGTDVALSDLLAISDTLSPDEHIRISLLETMIGRCMMRKKKSWSGKEWPDVCQMVRDLEIAFDRSQLSDNEWMTACSIANLAFIPQIFDDMLRIYHRELERKEFTWVREDTVVHISTHLDDGQCLQASISRLIDAIIEQKEDPGDYFGVAFSVYHCVIVKVIKDAHTTKFSHTAALQFLPSFHAYSPSTPGITALARLGYRVDPALFRRVTGVSNRMRYMPKIWREHDESQRHAQGVPNVHCGALLPELWREIALYLGPGDLLALGFVSKLLREVASTVLRHPHVCGYRLVAVLTQKPKSVVEGYRSLYTASFAAVLTGIPATATVGLGNKSLCIPFASDYTIWVPVSVDPDFGN